ncbi:hypothetical protein ACHAWF_004485 [Thalassiosira exigua]
MSLEQKKNIQAKNYESKRKAQNKQSRDEKKEINEKHKGEKKDRCQQIRNEKAERRKGLIADEKDWLFTPDFLKSEEKACDGKDGNKKTEQHYLDEMNQVCGFCNGRGFNSEIQGKIANPNNPNGPKLVHFGNLYCCKGESERNI